MIPTVTSIVLGAIAVSFFASQVADARKLCGKSLVVHVGTICQAVDCDIFENSTPKRRYSELALECCSRGCSQKTVEMFCCSNTSRAYGHSKLAKKTEEKDAEVIVI
ncbi:hypothetical protein AAVH_32664 [Aphelenchoides avenae]|nr:hypothetical protein AAVH_32664 [Aphelenchus avenae]